MFNVVVFFIFTLPCLLLASDSFSINVISATTELIAVSLNIENHLFDEVWYKIKRKDQSDNQLDYKDTLTQKEYIHRPSFFQDCNGSPFSPGTYGILAMIYFDADNTISSEAEIEVTIDYPVSLDDSDIIITPSSPKAGQEITITLHAKTHLNPKNTGGDVIFVDITNACIEGGDFLWHSDTTNTKDILDKTEVIKMEHKLNGIYLAKYTMPRKPGTITMTFYRMENGNMIRYQCYTLNSNSAYELAIHSGRELGNSLEGENICRDGINDVLTKWIGKILIPITKKVRISLDCRFRCDLFIDGEFFEATSENDFKSSISKDLEANRMYDIRLEYWESQYSSFQLKWDYLTGFSPIWTGFIWQPAEIKSDDILIKCRPFSYESQDGSCVNSTIRSLRQRQCPDPLCASCDQEHPSICLDCLSGIAILTKGECVCREGKYKDKLFDGSFTCSNCPINTYIPHSGTNTSCFECITGRYNNREGSDSCPFHCHKFCSKCTGGNRDQCSECKESETLVTLVGNTCECKSGYYFDISSNGCLPCDESCAECTSLTECTRCNDSKKRISDSGLCECDSKGYFEYNKECVECHDLCESCTGPSNTKCSSCKEGAILTEPQTCSCPYGKYYDPSKRKCERCHPSCSSCIGIEKHSCTNCRENYIFIQGQCIEQCQDGLYLDFSRAKCLPCDSDCETCSSPHECLTCMTLEKP